MSDQNINDTAYGVTKAVLESEAVSNLTNPPTKVAGGLLADFINLTAGGIHYASMKAELKRQKKFEAFKSNIEKGVENIPHENQVEPIDAQNLKCFANEERLPVCEIQLNLTDTSHRTLLTNVFCGNKLCNSIEQQSISLSSLSRIGIIKIAYDEYLTDDSFYKIFDSLPLVIGLKNQVEADNKINNTNFKIDLQKGVATLTPVGKAFIDVCLRPLPT